MNSPIDTEIQIEIDLLGGKIRHAYGELLSKFDPDIAIKHFDQVNESAPYHFVPNGVSKIWESVTDKYGTSGFEIFQKVTLLRLMSNFEARRVRKAYTDAVLQCFRNSFQRILQSMINDTFDAYSGHNDILLKDLAICRQKMFPAGVQVVEPDSAFGRSPLFSDGVAQAVRLTRLLLRTGGNSHWYQIHTHLSELGDFNPSGWDQCYLRLADMLAENSNIRGFYGSSWFYDPALDEISPRLVYLRRVPQENGASIFYSNVDIDGGALAKSEARNKAYESGRYLPKSYLLVWPRADLMQWAEAFRRTM